MLPREEAAMTDEGLTPIDEPEPDELPDHAVHDDLDDRDYGGDDAE